MKKKFTFLIAAVALLMMMVLPGKAVGQTSGNYTITFGNNASSATAISSTTNATTVISSGTNYVNTRPFTINSGNCYYGDTKTCIRVGKSGNDAELVIALSDAGKVKATSIVVNCKKMSGNKNNDATIAVNDLDAQSPASYNSDPSDLTFTFDNPTDIVNITLRGSKASMIFYITVNYTTTPVGPAVNATPKSLSGFSYIQGHGPSTQDKHIAVSGTNLSANLVVTASSNYEVCKTQEGTYESSVEFVPESNTVAESTVYVRLKANLGGGSYNSADDKLTVSSTGATSVNVSLDGSVTPTYTLTISANNGHIEDGDENVITTGAVAQGAEFGITAVPNTGYKFTSWSVTGTGSSVGSTNTNPTTFTMGSEAATLTANFSARTPATITWHEGNGGNTSTTTNTYADATIGDRTPASVNGWTALGWATSQTVTSQTAPTMVSSSTVVDDIDNPSHHIDLYAVYTKGSNTFELANSVTSGETYIVCANYSSTYYVLTNEDGDYMTKSSISVSSGSFNYTVGRKFVLSGDNTNGFTFYDGSDYLTGNSSSVNYLTLGGLTNYGKWSISIDNTTHVASINNKQNTSYYMSYYGKNGYFNCHTTPNTLYLFEQTSNDLDYTTAPTSEKCQVTYTANTGVGDDCIDDNGGSKYDVGATVTVWANEGTGKPNFTKEHYQFVNWNTAAEGNGTTYAAGATFAINANTTLYAQWSINKHGITMPSNDTYGTYSLSYNYNNSTVTSATDVPYGVEVTLNYTPATGYENYIATWSVNNSSISGNTFTMPDEDVTVTVSVEENPFVIIRLTGADMEQMHNAGTAYANIKTITINGYYWEAKAYNTTNQKNYLQINTPGDGNAAGSYIKLPIVNGKIETITCTVNSSNRYLYFNTTNSTSNPIATGGNGTAATSITIDMTNVFYQTGYIVSSGSIQITNISVKFRPYKNMSGTELTTIEADRTVSIPANINATATDLTIPASSGIIIKSGASLTVSGTLTNSGNANNLVIEDGGQLISNSSVQTTVKKSIAGHTRGTTGWNFIATTAVDGTTPTTANGILDATPANYDLFYYDEPYHYWRNYKDNEGHTNNDAGFVSDGGKLLNGKGYLYANANNAELSFEGATVAANKKIDLTLSYSDANLSFRGFNLVGNPFTYQLTSSSEITLNGTDFNTYYMIENGEEIKSTTISETPINPGTGFIVQADAENQHLVFNPDGVSKGERASKPSFIRIDAGNDGFMDRAYIQFGNVNTLRKFTLNDNTPKVYVMNNNLDWATTVINETVGEMPVCFKAVTDGQYTISVKPEGVEVSYLHLIDNIAGTDIDLLATPSYTFNAKGDDYESRFRLVFSAKSDNDTNLNEDFAFFSDGQLIVTGEGTLQVVDMMGRVISTEMVNGTTSKTIDAKAGVYVLRLINGENVKTQKIVVR